MPPDRVELCRGEVRHARRRPVRHAFRYPAFFIRVPLRGGAPAAVLRWFSYNRPNVLSLLDRDHGDGKTALLPWIDALLHGQGIHDADGQVWLQTMPRLFGFVFNPVSFWFCHRADGTLRAVLCEVNNTFGERHCYLLEDGAAEAEKVFHVSPFCRVEGRYRFRFAQRAGRHLAAIDYHDRDGILLRTSLTGIAQPMTDGAILRLAAAAPLATLAVVFRIHVQALRLWLRRVPFFSKPATHIPQVTR
ncbi:DUF1365 domain-containing protein [Pseudoduganella rhizocola]|uniref:DUF1365 domain-containing protein n=1 Tax=Pseudoduganella rhizocola TaxID=3382643 RepID=UPI0038B4397B